MSEFFQWDPQAYGVNVDAMDKEHERLIAIMNELHELHAAGAPALRLQNVVGRLGAFTVEHFEHEEAYMKSIGWPRLGVHQRIHEDLLEKFGKHAKELEAKGVLTDEFFLFLRRWLKAHIQGVDRQYGSPGLAESA